MQRVQSWLRLDVGFSVPAPALRGGQRLQVCRVRGEAEAKSQWAVHRLQRGLQAGGLEVCTLAM